MPPGFNAKQSGSAFLSVKFFIVKAVKLFIVMDAILTGFDTDDEGARDLQNVCLPFWSFQNRFFPIWLNGRYCS